MEMEYYKELWVAVKREFARFRLLCALIFAVVLIGVVCAGIFWPKAYESDALIYIDSVSVIEPLLDSRRDPSDADRVEQAQKLLYTRSLLKATAEKAGLLEPDASPEDVNKAVTHLRNGIMVEAQGKSYFRVSYWSSSPQRAYNVVDSLLETFIGNRAEAKQSDSSEAYSFINSQVEEYKQRLDEAERKLQEAKSQYPSISEASVKSRIGDLNAQIQDLKLGIQETESKIATTRQLLSEEDQYLNEQSHLQALKEQRRQLETELNQLRLSYQESYPDIVSIKAQLAEVKSAIESLGAMQGFGATGSAGEALFDELRKQLSVSEVNLKAQKKRLASLEDLLQEQYAKADDVAQHEARLDELTRDYNVLLDVYEKLLSRQENAKFSMALNMKNGGDGYQVIERPVYPLEPGGPEFVHFAVAAPFLGLGAPLGLLMALVMADPRIRSVTRMTQSIPPDLEIMGVIPHFDSPAERRAARAETAMLVLFCSVVFIGYGFLVYAGLNGLV